MDWKKLRFFPKDFCFPGSRHILLAGAPLQTVPDGRMYMSKRSFPPGEGSGVMRGAYLMLRRYLGHGVSVQSAALAFYLLFTMFPLMVFLSSLLGLLHLEKTELLQGLTQFLPAEVLDFVMTYLDYAANHSSVRLLLFGLFFSLYFPMRATNSLMRAVRTAYHLGPPLAPARHLFRTLLYTMMLIVTVVVTLTLMTAGRRLLDYAADTLGLPGELAVLWQWLRFPVTALVMYFALFLLYAMAQDGRQPMRNLWPGVVAALLGWMVLSALYSVYVDYIASYSLLYGSVGTAVVLLMWLYLTAVTLILGAELNGTLIALRREREGAAELQFSRKGQQQAAQSRGKG